MCQDIRDRVKHSLVTVYGRNGSEGLGFRVRDRIVTAAHCLPEMPNPFHRMLDTSVVVVDLASRSSPSMQARTLVAFVDPCTDLAVLGENGAGGTTLGTRNLDFLNRYRALIASLQCLSLDLKVRRMSQRLTGYVLTREGEWLSGEGDVGVCTDSRIWMKFNGPTRSGTSGAPIVNDRGEAFGVLSGSGVRDDNDARTVAMVHLSAAIPRWLQLVEDEEDQPQFPPAGSD